MLSLPDGQSIPDEMLESRDQGNVVFLCVGGVSYPAGMPDFLGLEKHVVHWARPKMPRHAGCCHGRDARPPLDQVFNLLQQEYDSGEVDSLIAKRLETKSEANVSVHETILRLSKNAAGKPPGRPYEFRPSLRESRRSGVDDPRWAGIVRFRQWASVQRIGLSPRPDESRNCAWQGQARARRQQFGFRSCLLGRGLGDALRSRLAQPVHRSSARIFGKRSFRQIPAARAERTEKWVTRAALRIRQRKSGRSRTTLARHRGSSHRVPKNGR